MKSKINLAYLLIYPAETDHFVSNLRATLISLTISVTNVAKFQRQHLIDSIPCKT